MGIAAAGVHSTKNQIETDIPASVFGSDARESDSLLEWHSNY
jgi:hypothetical protein